MKNTRFIIKGMFCAMAYIVLSGAAFGQTQTSFNYTGSSQTFTVPCAVDSIFIEAWGGQGQAGLTAPAGNLGGAGGNGGHASGWKQVNQGDVITIYVGGAGSNGIGGFNGGGNGGDNLFGAGGGSSDVRFGGITEAYRILVAGGGGGGGNAGCSDGAPSPGDGGAGGAGVGGVGIDGVDSPTGGGVAGGGKGGNYLGVQGAFGPAGIGCGGYLGLPGNTTVTSVGANGGGGQNCCCTSGISFPSGGGGGGGYLGGGSGGGGSAGTTGCSGNSKGAGGGGGGGSSFVGGVLNGTILTGQLVGNGLVTITYSSSTPTTPTVLLNAQGICAGSTLPISCSSVNLATSYVWNVTGGVSINSGQGTNSIVVSATGPGTISVLAVNAGCNLSSAPSAPYSLSLFTLPDVTASVSPNPTCTGDSVVFQAQGALTYQWNNGIVNGVPVSIATSGSFNVIGLDANGCSNSSSVSLIVNQSTQNQINLTEIDSAIINGEVYYQSGQYTQVLQNANGCDSVLTIDLIINYTGLSELAASASVYPNPTSTTLTVKFAKAHFESYSIINLDGKEVLFGVLNGVNTTIDVQTLKAGVYNLKFKGESSVVRFTKL